MGPDAAVRRSGAALSFDLLGMAFFKINLAYGIRIWAQ